VLWEGDPPRRRAAETLSNTKDPEAVEALVSILDDKDPVLALKAVSALGKIGNTKAVPALIPLLGERDPVGQASLAEGARDALVDLGAEDLVRAFERALKGNADPLKERMGKHRPAFVDALIGALYSPELTEFVHAAEALGVIGAVEALPNLREKRLDRDGWELGREACRNVIAELESRASLPRPAGAVRQGVDTLPRSTTEPGSDTGTLLRPLDSTDGEA